MEEKDVFQTAIRENKENYNSALAETVVSWAANKWVVPRGLVYDFFDIQASSYFLLIWPIFEHDVCNGFMETKKIRNIAKKFHDYYDEMQIDDILRRFYDRYKDRGCPDTSWDSLCQNDVWDARSKAESVLNKGWDKSGPVDKLQFGLYVIYRFRNNIFHGNKSVLEWLRNRPQIEDCVMVLLKLTEFHDKMSHEGQF